MNNHTPKIKYKITKHKIILKADLVYLCLSVTYFYVTFPPQQLYPVAGRLHSEVLTWGFPGKYAIWVS